MPQYARVWLAVLIILGTAWAGDPDAAVEGRAQAAFSSSRTAQRRELLSQPLLTGAQESAAPQHFQWMPALEQTSVLLGVMHSYRFAQHKTRDELGGPFFDDWGASIAGIRHGWSDGDRAITNYLGHPVQGAIAGFIEVQNDPAGRLQTFGASSSYWKSRLRAMAWAAAESAQFEIGPISEASIGNVGKKWGTNGAVDLVITPTVGTGLLVLEDYVDRSLIPGLERRTGSPTLRALERSFLNPTRSLANLLRRKRPWHRDTRPGVLVDPRF